MKKITSVIIISLILALVFAIGTFAASSNKIIASGDEDNFTWKLDNDGVLYVNGDYVQSYGANSSKRAPWYDYRSQIYEIEFDDDIFDIGTYAFYGLNKVTKVTLPESLTAIGQYAFSDCTSLKSIDIPKYVRTINTGAFYNCSALRSVNLPSDLKTIRSYAFQNCRSLLEIMIYEDVTTIGDKAFYGCSKLTEVYFVGDRPTTLSDTAFEDLDENDDLVIYYTKGSTGFTKSYWSNYSLDTFTYTGKNNSKDDDDDGWLGDGSSKDDDVYYGDLNGDGKVNSTDLRYLRYCLGYYKNYTYKKYEDMSDVDDDGKLTPKDEIHLARYLDGWKGYKLPA